MSQNSAVFEFISAYVAVPQLRGLLWVVWGSGVGASIQEPSCAMQMLVYLSLVRFSDFEARTPGASANQPQRPGSQIFERDSQIGALNAAKQILVQLHSLRRQLVGITACRIKVHPWVSTRHEIDRGDSISQRYSSSQTETGHS